MSIVAKAEYFRRVRILKNRDALAQDDMSNFSYGKHFSALGTYIEDFICPEAHIPRGCYPFLAERTYWLLVVIIAYGHCFTYQGKI